MNVAVRLAVFAVGVGLLAGASALVGRASGVDVGSGSGTHDAMQLSSAGTAAGLTDSADGISLVLRPSTLRPGVRTTLDLRLLDEDSHAVTNLDEGDGEPPLHLILVRRDLGGYQHVHPVRTGDRFTVDVTLPDPGGWRAYADFEIDGAKTVLGVDVVVPGTVIPVALPEPTRSTTVAGYRVELTGDVPRAGAETRVGFRITRGGEPIGVQQYLGADGHLVAIRRDDLSYLHVHPVEDSPAGVVAFDAEFAEPGRYALFLQFKHRGVVRTAPFTLDVAR